VVVGVCTKYLRGSKFDLPKSLLVFDMGPVMGPCAVWGKHGWPTYNTYTACRVAGTPAGVEQNPGICTLVSAPRPRPVCRYFADLFVRVPFKRPACSWALANAWPICIFFTRSGVTATGKVFTRLLLLVAPDFSPSTKPWMLQSN
jgi:hypothetical protein